MHLYAIYIYIHMDICIYDLIRKNNACKEVYWRPHEYQAHKSRVAVVFGVNYSSECSDPFMKYLLVIQIGKLNFHNSCGILFILENIMKYLQIIELNVAGNGNELLF